MVEHQIQLQNFNINTELPGIWEKEWVRPFESLWGIINTYKRVNSINNHNTLMRNIGADIKTSTSKDYFLSYGIFCNLSNKNDVNKIISKFVPEWYITQIESTIGKNALGVFFADKISYCPICIKNNGYHSLLHQLKGLEKCPFHPQISMKPYFKQRYILGKQSEYKIDKYSSNRVGWVCGRLISSDYVDFEDISQLPFPFEWKSLSQIEEYFRVDGIRNDFDTIKAIGADLDDKNIIPAIGKFLLKSNNIKPDVTIYNILLSDKLITMKFRRKIEELKLDINFYMRNDNFNLRNFKYLFLKITIMDMLQGYSMDEIEYKSYKINMGKEIAPEDMLGIKLLFIYFLLGGETVEECLYMINNVIENDYAYSFFPSDVCIHELSIENLSISVQNHILEMYIISNYNNFRKYVNSIKDGIVKPQNRKDYILHPINIIYKSFNGIVYLYQC